MIPFATVGFLLCWLSIRHGRRARQGCRSGPREHAAVGRPGTTERSSGEVFEVDVDDSEMTSSIGQRRAPPATVAAGHRPEGDEVVSGRGSSMGLTARHRLRCPPIKRQDRVRAFDRSYSRLQRAHLRVDRPARSRDSPRGPPPREQGEIGRRPVDPRPRSRQVPRQRRGLAIIAQPQIGVLLPNCSQRSHNQAVSVCKTGAWARRKPVPASRPRLPSCPPRDERGAVSRAKACASGRVDAAEEGTLSAVPPTRAVNQPPS
jgi:hypothetical protein